MAEGTGRFTILDVWKRGPTQLLRHILLLTVLPDYLFKARSRIFGCLRASEPTEFDVAILEDINLKPFRDNG